MKFQFLKITLFSALLTNFSFSYANDLTDSQRQQINQLDIIESVPPLHKKWVYKHAAEQFADAGEDGITDEDLKKSISTFLIFEKDVFDKYLESKDDVIFARKGTSLYHLFYLIWDRESGYVIDPNSDYYGIPSEELVDEKPKNFELRLKSSIINKSLETKRLLLSDELELIIEHQKKLDPELSQKVLEVYSDKATFKERVLAMNCSYRYCIFDLVRDRFTNGMYINIKQRYANKEYVLLHKKADDILSLRLLIDEEQYR